MENTVWIVTTAAADAAPAHQNVFAVNDGNEYRIQRDVIDSMVGTGHKMKRQNTISHACGGNYVVNLTDGIDNMDFENTHFDKPWECENVCVVMRQLNECDNIISNDGKTFIFTDEKRTKQKKIINKYALIFVRKSNKASYKFIGVFKIDKSVSKPGYYVYNLVAENAVSLGA